MSSIMLEDYLKDAGSVAIGGHVKPDGDCVGSTLAVYNYIRDNHPDIDVDIYLQEIPNIFRFLNYSEEIIDPSVENGKTYDLFICLDCGDERRLGESMHRFESAKKTLCIDHHKSNIEFADINYVVGDASSTCELIYGVIDEKYINKAIAECLYTGIVHDTGVFQYSCTKESTMRIAGRLMEKGIDFTRIVDETFYAKTYEQNRILGKAVNDARLYLDGRVIATFVSRQDMEDYNVKPKHLDGIVNQLRITKGTDVAIFVYETEDDGLKFSTRANADVDLAELAVMFGGGGHNKAAGFNMYKSYEESLEDYLEVLKTKLL